MGVPARLAARGVLVVAASIFPCSGGADTARFDVHATVPRYAAILEATEPGCLAAQGQLEPGAVLRASAAYRVRSTSTEGIELVFAAHNGPYASLMVRVVGATGAVYLPPEGGSITLRGHPLGEERLDVEYRFTLERAIDAACMPWPVAVGARPL